MWPLQGRSPESGCPITLAGVGTAFSVDQALAPPSRSGHPRTEPPCKPEVPTTAPPPRDLPGRSEVSPGGRGARASTQQAAGPGPAPWAAVNQPRGRQQRGDDHLEQTGTCPHPMSGQQPHPQWPKASAPRRGGVSPVSMLSEQGSSSQSSLSWQLDWAFQVLAKLAPVASTRPPAVLKSSLS